MEETLDGVADTGLVRFTDIPGVIFLCDEHSPQVTVVHAEDNAGLDTDGDVFQVGTVYDFCDLEEDYGRALAFRGKIIMEQ